MASAPYRIIDKRSSAGYSSTNRLIESAIQTSDRQAVPLLDYDVHRTVSNLGRRTLMSLGRALFWRFPALQGMVLEQANVAVSTFIPQYTGRNKAWGKQAEQVLLDWHKVMDIAGWPYDYDSFVQSLVISQIIEGETFTLLTETPEGYPLIQTIPTHRVGSRLSAQITATVRFEGSSMWINDVLVDDSRPYPAMGVIEFEARLIDGVLVDDFSRAISYRVYEDNFASGNYVDIPSRNFFPSFCPIATGQVRGFSLMASSAFDWQDMSEWKRFEMLAQKALSTRTIIETNETGDEDSAKSIIRTAATFDETGKKTDLDVQRLYGGTIQYLKAGSGSKVEAFGYDRPGGNSREFLKTTLRDAMRGTEWDAFFSLDPQGVGGAAMRVIVEKINMVGAKRRKSVRKTCMRVDGYAISKFMQIGILPWDDDWFRWEYQGPGEVTADKKYDSEVDLAEIAAGIGTRKLAAARRGLYQEELDAQRELEADSDLTAAGRLSKKHGISIQEALMVLRPPSTSATTLSVADEPVGGAAPPATESNQPPVTSDQ